MDIAQRFCRGCPKMSGFTVDEESGMQVCGNCGLPWEAYYLAMRAKQPEGEPIRYARGWDLKEHLAELSARFSRPTSRRARTRVQD